MAQQSTKILDLLDLHCNEDFAILETQLNHQKSPVQEQFLDHDQVQNEVLEFLLCKQEETYSVSRLCSGYLQETTPLSAARRQAVDWVLGVTSYHSFSALTAFLSVSYLDQFLIRFQVQRASSVDEPVLEPWMVQLAAVACVSLAAKVEEIHVPLLLDLQSGGSRYAFEPRSVQKMELVVLLALDWRMNPVTPFAFLKDITGRILGLERCREMEFVRLFGICIVSRVLTDPRFVVHRSSVVAAAVAVQVMKKMDFGSSLDDQHYKIELHKFFRFRVEEFEECGQYLKI